MTCQHATIETYRTEDGIPVMWACFVCRMKFEPIKVEERNFCPRCGKRNGPSPSIHTCTPPKDNWAYPVNNTAS